MKRKTYDERVRIFGLPDKMRKLEFKEASFIGLFDRKICEPINGVSEICLLVIMNI